MAYSVQGLKNTKADASIDWNIVVHFINAVYCIHEHIRNGHSWSFLKLDLPLRTHKLPPLPFKQSSSPSYFLLNEFRFPIPPSCEFLQNKIALELNQLDCINFDTKHQNDFDEFMSSFTSKSNHPRDIDLNILPHFICMWHVKCESSL